jgi:hypothetical protein
MNETWSQIIVAIFGFGATLLGAIKYSMNQTVKREERLMKMFEDSQGNIINLYKFKNGQIERISKDFVGAVREGNKATIESNRQTEITREKLSQAISDLRDMIRNNTTAVTNNTRTTEKALTIAEEINK